MTVYVISEAQRQSEHRLERMLLKIHTHAHSAVRYRQKESEVSLALNQLEDAHPEFAKASTHQVTKFWLLIAGLPAVYLGDLLLSSPTSEWFARRFLGGSPEVVILARFIIPLAILLAEIFISIQRYHAKEDAEEDSHAYRLWNACALLLFFVMPALTAAAQIASRPIVANDTVNQSFWVRTAAIVALAFVFHGIVLFSGRLLHEAKAYFVFSIKRSRFRRTIQHCGDEFEREALAMTRTLITYLRQVREHTHCYPQSGIGPGPFDAVTRDLLRERFR
jgi:hypothetical protein